MKKPNNCEINFRIQKILIKRNVTISELAERMGLTKQRVSYILLTKEDNNWKISTLKKIATCLKMDFEEFLWEVLFDGKL
jgi:DNA-binding Xre family transcriptional regulator